MRDKRRGIDYQFKSKNLFIARNDDDNIINKIGVSLMKAACIHLETSPG